MMRFARWCVVSLAVAALAPARAQGPTVFGIDGADMVYDAVRGQIIVSTSSRSALDPRSLVWIDPAAGTVLGSLPLGEEPGRLAMAGDGSVVYVALVFTGHVLRIDLATRLVDLDFYLGNGRGPYPRHASDLAVVPGSPSSVAVSYLEGGTRGKYGYTTIPPFGGVAVFDDGIPRPGMIDQPANVAAGGIEFGDDPSALYGLWGDSVSYFRRMTVGGSGVAVQDSLRMLDPVRLAGDIAWSEGLLYSANGREFDPVSRSLVGSFDPPLEGAAAVAPGRAPDPVVMCKGNSLYAFDRTTRRLDAGLTLPGFVGPDEAIEGLVRWGTDGLACRIVAGPESGSSGRVVLLGLSDLVVARVPVQGAGEGGMRYSERFSSPPCYPYWGALACNDRTRISATIRVPMTLTEEQVGTLNGESAIVFGIKGAGSWEGVKTYTECLLKDGGWKPGRRTARWSGWVHDVGGSSNQAWRRIRARWSPGWLRISYRLDFRGSPPRDSFLSRVEDSPVGCPAEAWVGIGISGPGIQEMSYDLGGTLEASSRHRLSGTVRQERAGGRIVEGEPGGDER